MRIHGKILTHYLSCSSPVDKEGYLYKKGELNTSYQRRWFVLKGNLLFYSDRQGDRDVLGAIVLEGCSVQLCESEEQFAFSLVFSEPGLRTYKFSADDQPSQEGWIKALHSAQHSYLALLLHDLHDQYLEASKAAGMDPVKPSPAWGESMSQLASASSVFYAPNTAPGANNLLQAPPFPGKSAIKKSPKLWPKRNAHVAPINGPAPPPGEWAEPAEDFGQLHEHFGKEVKELIADWLKRGQEVVTVPEGNLIDLN